MIHFILQILTIVFLCFVNPIFAQEIWHEEFNTPGKGIWADDEGVLCSDFSGIKRWTLEYKKVHPVDPDDYAKTVTTGGGRFEARDINGEVTWRSEWIDIQDYDKVKIELTTSETGSGNNTETKYLKAFYRLDNDPPVPFHQNAENAGNWGSRFAVAEGLEGALLQIVCTLSTHYASDKVILDAITVRKDIGPLPPVQPFEVVINELMPDPVPQVSLPKKEYIELYNTRNFPVSTLNWQLRINGVTKKIPKTMIEPHDFLLLCATGALDSLKVFGKAVNVPGFQGLLNNGALVEILDDQGIIIDRISYAATWYHDKEKEDGGWSLERIDPFRHCNQQGNWKASRHPDGGTPCAKNSILGNNPDLRLPFVKWAVPVAEREIELAFSEPMDTFLLQNNKNYCITGWHNPAKIIPATSTKVILQFESAFSLNTSYTLEIFNLTDECSNPLQKNHFQIQRNIIEPGDVLVSELLFNPVPGGEDYVEIYNASEKLIDLSRLSLATRDKQHKPVSVHAITEERKICPPGRYRVMTKDTGAVFPWFIISDTRCFLQMERIPRFADKEGCVVLLNEEMQVIDELNYHEGMHSPFLAEQEGISLERVSFRQSSDVPGNWQSASSLSGYGTPGYENSQAGKSREDKPAVTFKPDVFSPDLDGYNDHYVIHYELNQPGYVSTVRIFDAEGRFVQHLIKNELLGTRGEIVWNGKDATGSMQPPGIYVVAVEIFNDRGDVIRAKDGVALTGNMK